MSTEIKTLFRVEGDESAKANSNTRYTLFSENEDGDPKDVNPNNLDAWLRGFTNIRGSIARIRAGTYSIDFIVPPDPGTYHLDVTQEGRPIFRKGDIQLEVNSSDPVRARLTFEMEGYGIYGGRVGENAEFNITVKDDYGKPVDIDYKAVQVIIQGQSTVRVGVRPEQVGRYRANFTVDQPGDYHIDILYDNRKVMEKNMVKFSEYTKPSSSTIHNAPDRVRSNTDIQFSIISKDSRGRRINVGGDNWEAIASGPERVTRLVIKDNDDGSYTVTTSLPLQGVYSFDVRCQGESAQNSPIKIRVD